MTRQNVGYEHWKVEWKQGTDCLLTREGGYCCLGVACALGNLFDENRMAIYKEEHVPERHDGVLPGNYYKRLGLKSPKGETGAPFQMKECIGLMTLLMGII